MPVVVAKGAIIVVSVAVAAAIAVYESPEVRRYAEDVRRRIAIALHSLGDEINPVSQQPRFNRPEDAQGFIQSRAEPGVDADEETKRRQREELMYWNAIHMEKVQKERKIAESSSVTERPANKSRGSNFDDFLDEDHTAEKGTYVYNTGADVYGDTEEGLTRRRGGVRGLGRGALYANPFADEHHIDNDKQRTIDASLMLPGASEKFEIMSDVYSATDKPSDKITAILAKEEQLVDISEPAAAESVSYPAMSETEAMLDTENNGFTAGQGQWDSTHASIHAWADNANNNFYSPLSTTPHSATPQQHLTVPGSPALSTASESISSDTPALDHLSGEATPTDSASLASSGEEVWAPRSGATSEDDVMSVDGEGISTPGSWTEVGSVVSENDVGVHH
jgi:hypothetical protein